MLKVELPETTRPLTDAELEMARSVARAYRTSKFHAYVNEFERLCVICDHDDVELVDGFMLIDGIVLEFEPTVKEV